MNKKYNQMPQDGNKTRVNEQIRCYSVMLVEGDENLGVFHPDVARQMARDQGLDLVEVAPQSRPPVCRIMDYGKFCYEQSVKEKERKRKQKQAQVQDKILRFGPSIAEHDLVVKINSAKKFLEDSHRVVVQLTYKKRENAHKELGFIVIQRILKDLVEFGEPQSQPRLEGSSLNCIIEPKSK